MSSAVGRLGRFGLSSYFTLLVLFLYAPLVVLVVFSFEDSYIQALPWAGFTTKWFHTAFANSDLTSALRRSAMIGLLDGLAATALGTMAAVALARRHLFLRPLWTTLLLLPLVVPYIVLAIGMVIVLHQLGYQSSLSAVLVGHIAISLPYSLLVVLPRLRTLDASIVEAARDLGANPSKAFMLVTLAAAGAGAGCERDHRLHDLLRRVRDRLVHRASRLPHLPGVPVLGDTHAFARAPGDRDRRDRGGAVDGAGALGRDRPAVGRQAAGVSVESQRWPT